MKVFLPILFVTAGVLLAACESDLPPEPKSEGPLRRGITGQGKIVPVDQANDPLIQETSGPATGPAY